MDAQTLDATFGVGFSPVKSFDFNFRLNAPSHPGTAVDADV